MTDTHKSLRHLDPGARLEWVARRSDLSTGSQRALGFAPALPPGTADGMIENVTGTFELPLGVATNFLINGKDYLIPMAVEEPSVVAAASHMAKIARPHGGFTAKASDPIMRAQIQLLGLADLHAAEAALLAEKAQLIAAANACDPVLVGLGGGCRDVELAAFPETAIGPMLVLHLLVDVRDAMGANTVNTMAESVTSLVETITGGRVRLRILSNLADKRTVTAEVALPVGALDMGATPGAEVAKGIAEASVFAEVDPYRAATHNKGIMNGIDPIVVATGNDWRAVEAGAHAFAAMGARYGPLSTWRAEAGVLKGQIKLPMALGLVGGATKTHPAAQAALEMMQVETASELAEIVAAVGLAQNLAALRALATEGIQRGHMKLHARNIATLAGATGPDVDSIAALMVKHGTITVAAAQALLKG